MDNEIEKKLSHYKKIVEKQTPIIEAFINSINNIKDEKDRAVVLGGNLQTIIDNIELDIYVKTGLLLRLLYLTIDPSNKITNLVLAKEIIEKQDKQTHM